MGVGQAVAALLIALMQGAFCQTWNVMLPQSIVGISGSCITIPCRFEVPKDQEKNILNCSDGGVWNKGNLVGPSVFIGRNLYASTLKGRIDGDLTRKNCTTTFSSFPDNYSDMYFFRLDCLNSFKYTFKTGVLITVQPGPSPPLLTSVGQVSEGAQVRLQCSVPVPCVTLPPYITWHPRDSSWKAETLMQQNADRQMIMMSTLTFIASADHHNQSITCSVSYPLANGSTTQSSATTQTLNVLYAPKFLVATLSPSCPVSEGRTVTLTCLSDANSPVSLYTWYRADTGKLTKKGEGEILVLTVSRRDSGVYLCEAQTQRGSRRSVPVTLEVAATAGRSLIAEVIPYILCGVMLVLFLLTVVVGVCKYQSLSRRLKQVELKGEHTYADLRKHSVTSDYDQLQLRQPKPMSPPGVPNYENLRK